MNTLHEFQAAIEIECEKNSKDYDEQMKLPLHERVAKGVSMSNLSVAFDFFDGAPNQWCPMLSNSQRYIASARISCGHNISKFKEGSSVLLCNGPYKFEMEVAEDSVETFMLKPNDFNVKCCYVDFSGYPKNNWEINMIKTDIGTKLLLTAAKVLEEDSETLDRIDNFLNGETRNHFGDFCQTKDSLDKSQNKAYLDAINSSNYCLIQGPPGTGKTETIGCIAKHFVDCGLKVFITAPTHTAINNCLKAVSRKVKNAPKAIKIGDKPQNKELQDDAFILTKTRFPYSNAKYDSAGIAIGATAYSLCYPASKRLDGWEFDVAIIDEASQLSIPLSIAAMLRSKKWIFVGDHKQLDPIIPKGTNNEMFAESIFSRLARLYDDRLNLLGTSYRLNNNLVKIPNALFYEDSLAAHSGTKVDDRIYKSASYSKVLNGDSHILLLHDVFDSQGRSPFEAKLVAELVCDLLQNGISTCDIGLMSPYRAQVREIKRELKKTIPRSMHNASLETLFVDTVDSMQGQEKDYIIYSMSNSNPLESMRRLDFFYSPNRLNVAITRAIRKCIVIANYKIFDIKDEELRGHKEYESVRSCLDIFKQYYNLSSKIERQKNDDDKW